MKNIIPNQFLGEFFGQYNLSIEPYFGPDFSKKCIIFSGQGSVKPGMFLDYYENNLVIESWFHRADQLAREQNIPLISDYLVKPKIIPPEHLIPTRILALLTLELAQFDCLLQQNVKPSLMTGHSFGDLPALVAAGCVSYENMFDIVLQREALSPEEYSQGYLLVAYCECEKLIPYQEALDNSFFIANINSPDETVIAVSEANLKRVRSTLKRVGIKTNILRSVPHPYHSPLMVAVSKGMKSFLAQQKHTFSPPTYPLLSSTTLEVLTSKNFHSNKVIEIIANNVIAPINFVRQVNSIYSMGITHFIELGPAAVCTGFAEKTLTGKLGNNEILLAEFATRYIEKRRKPNSTLDETTKRLFHRVNKIIGKITGYEIAQISIEDKYQEELGIDSLKKAEIIVSVLDDFNIDSEDSIAVSEFESIEDTVEFIKRAQSAGPNKTKTRRETQFKLQTPKWIAKPIDALHSIEIHATKLPIVWLDPFKLHQGCDSLTNRDQIIALAFDSQTAKNFDQKRAIELLISLQQLVLSINNSESHFICVTPVPNNIYAEIAFNYLTSAAKEKANCTAKTIFIDDDFNDGFNNYFYDKESLKFLLHVESLQKEKRVKYQNNQREILLLQQIDSTSQGLQATYSDKVIVVIGGAQGIANALLNNSCFDNSHLYIIGRSALNQDNIAKQFPLLSNTNIQYISCDACDSDKFYQAITTIVNQHKHIDILINSAGMVNVSMLEEKSESDISIEFNSKVIPAKLCLEFAEKLPIHKVINFSSVLGFFGGTGQTIYSAANTTIDQLTQSFNHRNPNRLSAVSICWPPWDNTGMTENKLVSKQLKDLGLSLLSREQGQQFFLNDLKPSNSQLQDCRRFYFDDNDHFNYGTYSKDISQQKLIIGESKPRSAKALTFIKSFNLAADEFFLRDHLVGLIPYVPAAQQTAMLYFAAKTFYQESNILLSQIRFESPFIINVSEQSRLDLQARKENIQLTLSSKVRHAIALAKKVSETKSVEGKLFPEKNPIELDHFYLPKESSNKDIYHGPYFRVLNKAYFNTQGTLVTKTQFTGLQQIYGGFAFGYFTFFLEAAFQTLGLKVFLETGVKTIPTGIHELRVCSLRSSHNSSEPYFISVDNIKEHEEAFLANINILTQQGELLMEVSSVTMTPLQSSTKLFRRRMLFKRSMERSNV